MKLTTRYLGLTLAHPFMLGASPLADNLDTVRRLEDAGAAAIVMRSLFEEQLETRQLATVDRLDWASESFAEASPLLPEPDEFSLGPDRYLTQLAKIREAVGIPIIASLNGTEGGFWLDYAASIEQAGAHALELNVFDVAAELDVTGSQLEARLLLMVRRLRDRISIPFAVKLSPFYTALTDLTRKIVDEGADGLVIFNRFYEADVDVESLELRRSLSLSSSAELPLRLRWLAILSSRVDTSLAVTGGVHSVHDAAKALMCGADAVQMVSAVLRRGPAIFTAMRDQLARWIEDNGYRSLRQLRGSMNLSRCPDPGVYLRANYIRMLQSLKGLT
jgi:dihydroorotate dehydrogenase (fumarate)